MTVRLLHLTIIVPRDRGMFRKGSSSLRAHSMHVIFSINASAVNNHLLMILPSLHSLLKAVGVHAYALTET